MNMMGVNCRSSSASCPSYQHQRSLIVHENGLQQNILNSSPRLSSESNPIVQLKKTADSQSIVSIPSYGTQKSSTELRKEIATLEGEIMLLERYLLSLYRTAFKEHVQTLSSITGNHLEYKIGSPKPVVPKESHYKLEPQIQNHLEYKTGSPKPILPKESYCKLEPQIQKVGFFHHDQALPAHDLSTSHNSAACVKSASKMDWKYGGSGHCSLADHLGASCKDNNLNTPDRLSEDIIRCISSIYCKLTNTPQSLADISNSPTSSLSSSSIFSSKNPCDSWSPHCFEDVSAHNQNLKEGKGAHTVMTEVLKIYLDDDSFNYASVMLQNFRSLIRSLEKVDPGRMKREEKLAFWINIHNALVMHAYLAYGTRNRVKSTSILKAAYNVGGHHVDAYVIQSAILGIRPHYSAPWLQTLLSPGRKFKMGSIKHVYALEYTEPLVHFALCSGAYSDPVVRVYTSKSIFHDLKLAKEEFIQSGIYIHKESKIFLPKILYYFAKDMSLDVLALFELITGCLSESQQKTIRKCIKGRHEKCINWLPQSSTFQYVIHGDLAKERYPELRSNT